jgi:hypothetical protein
MSELISVQGNAPAIQSSGLPAMTFPEMMQFCDFVSRSELVPDAYKGKPANVMLAMLAGQRLGYDPFTMMQESDVLHGRVTLRSRALANLVAAKGVRISYETQPTGKAPVQFQNGTVMPDIRCRAIFTYPDGAVFHGAWVSFAMAKAEGWIDRKGSKWTNLPEQMLRYRAVALADRASGASGSPMMTSEEVQDIPFSEVTPPPSAPPTIPPASQKPPAVTPPADEPKPGDFDDAEIV